MDKRGDATVSPKTSDGRVDAHFSRSNRQSPIRVSHRDSTRAGPKNNVADVVEILARVQPEGVSARKVEKIGQLDVFGEGKQAFSKIRVGPTTEVDVHRNELALLPGPARKLSHPSCPGEGKRTVSRNVQHVGDWDAFDGRKPPGFLASLERSRRACSPTCADSAERCGCEAHTGGEQLMDDAHPVVVRSERGEERDVMPEPTEASRDIA